MKMAMQPYCALSLGREVGQVLCSLGLSLPFLPTPRTEVPMPQSLCNEGTQRPGWPANALKLPLPASLWWEEGAAWGGEIRGQVGAARGGVWESWEGA